MRYHHELRYDASPEDVRAMLADPEFRERVCEAQGATDWTVEADGTGGQVSVVVDQRRPAQGIPGFARKVVGDEIHIVQREDWTDPHSASLDVEIPGKPGRLRGTITLAADGAGTLETVTGDLRVDIPLVGRKLEGLIGELLDAALAKEQELGRSWLQSG